MKYLEESHKTFNELGDQQKIIGSMNNLGNLHSDLQLYEQALRYYTEAWQLSTKSGKMFSDPLNNIGNLYFRQGNYQRAIEYYGRALEIARQEKAQRHKRTLIRPCYCPNHCKPPCLNPRSIKACLPTMPGKGR